jgi:hypothetical protein
MTVLILLLICDHPLYFQGISLVRKFYGESLKYLEGDSMANVSTGYSSQNMTLDEERNPDRD